MTPILISEEDIIQRYFAPLAAGYPGAFGLRDDCATVTPPAGTDLVVKTDPVRAGVHFFPDDAPEDIAWKALAVNISDLAAKGATPLAYLAAMSFPAAPEAEWMARFAHGLADAQLAFGCQLIGGDTDRAPGPLSIAMTVFGTVPSGRMVRRGTARAGDRVFVTGTLGASAFGLKIRRGDRDALAWSIDTEAKATLLRRYARPQPRLALAPALLAHASAAMDISDGLHKDFDRMCRASCVGGRINVSQLPVDATLAALIESSPDLHPLVWSGGDDYEILCSVLPQKADAFKSGAFALGVPVAEIGVITKEAVCVLHKADGKPVPAAMTGYVHF